MRAGLPIPADMRMVQECFRILKAQIIFKGTMEPFRQAFDNSYHSPPTSPTGCAGIGNEDSGSQNPKDFPQLLARRDAEISKS